MRSSPPGIGCPTIHQAVIARAAANRDTVTADLAVIRSLLTALPRCQTAEDECIPVIAATHDRASHQMASNR